MKIYCSGGLVFNKYNQIIVVKNLSGTVTFPKGHIEKNETPFSTAIREIYEESGVLDLKLIKYLGSYERPKIKNNCNNIIKKIFVFLFETNQTNITPIDPHIKEAKWVNILDILKILTYQEDITFLSNINL